MEKLVLIRLGKSSPYELASEHYVSLDLALQYSFSNRLIG